MEKVAFFSERIGGRDPLNPLNPPFYNVHSVVMYTMPHIIKWGKLVLSGQICRSIKYACLLTLGKYSFSRSQIVGDSRKQLIDYFLLELELLYKTGWKMQSLQVKTAFIEKIICSLILFLKYNSILKYHLKI